MTELQNAKSRPRVMFITLAPPENHCGIRLVMHRHLIERNPFELLVVTDATYVTQELPHEQLQLPSAIERLRRTRFHRWAKDFRTLVWPNLPNGQIARLVGKFRPEVILTVGDNAVCGLAWQTAKRFKLPLAGLFLDWFPIMDGYSGHRWTRPLLSARYRRLYSACDLAICTSDGMQEVLGPHPNSHVVYPMPGRHKTNEALPRASVQRNGKFRLVYVGCVEHFYGRMLCSVIERLQADQDIELIVVGPNADWPPRLLELAKARGVYLGFKPAEEAAQVLAGADGLLVVMSFESESRLFMQTSFTTKFLDYSAYGKPIILWGPDYCTPVKVARRDGGALVVDQSGVESLMEAARRIASDQSLRQRLSDEATRLHRGLFNPERLQEILVREVSALVN